MFTPEVPTFSRAGRFSFATRGDGMALQTYEGSSFFRQKLILATISGKPVKIKKIRAKDDEPGVTDYEASLLHLLDKVTNGSTIEVNETGTVVYYQPGMLDGGSVEHDCNLKRAIGYYLEMLLCLAPFCKKPMKAVLRGITSDRTDPSVDLIKLSSFPVLKRFLGTDEGLELKVTRRGAAPQGGGEVMFSCPTRQKLRPIQYTDPGKVKRIRGVVWATRVSPATCNRVVDSARSVLNNFIPDIYIHTDHLKGSQSGKSPGFGLTLVAETTNGTFLCAEDCSSPKNNSDNWKPTIPEDLGINTAKLLLQEIYNGGCVDNVNQALACLMMSLGDKDVSKIKTGQLTPHTIGHLRLLKDFLGVSFKLENEKINDEEESLKLGGQKVLMTCVGVGYRNYGKSIM